MPVRTVEQLKAREAALGQKLAEKGPSMEPAYHQGDRVLVDKYVWHILGLKPGTVVVFDDPRGRKALDIKRVSDIPAEQGTYFLLGDAPNNSTDSRVFGSVPSAYIHGRVIMTLQ